jgi:acetylornithine deacetylase
MITQYTINPATTREYLEKMVSIDSTNPTLVEGGAGEDEMAVWLATTCQDLGLEVATQQTAAHRPNVIARWRGTGEGRSILLTGHMDVVGTLNMDIAPFTPKIEQGRLYGRGAYDMKGGLASILGAVAALKESGFEPKGNIILGFVTDEEYASIGTERLIHAVEADAAILTEPTDLHICLAHKGFAWLTIRTEGRAAHGSLHHEGVDAIKYMRHVLNAMHRLETELLPQRSHPLLGRPSVHASNIAGGLGWSTYPDACNLMLEHRFLPDESAAGIVTQWEDLLAEISQEVEGFKADIQLDLERPGYEIEREHPVVKTLDSAYQTVIGDNPAYNGSYPWLDASLLGRAGIPTVVFGPSGAGAHAAVEYADLDSVAKCAQVMAEAVAQWTSESD